MITSIEAIHAKQCIDQGNGEFTATIPDSRLKDYKLDTGAVPESGAVYSMNPNGSLEARPVGTNGSWEKFKVVGTTAIFASGGVNDMAHLIPFAPDIPNS
jgi:hypothetical protein